MNGKSATAAHGVTLESLVEEHFDYLYRYAYRYFRSDEKAEDLVQDTFLAAAEGYSRFEGKSSPRTWLTSILRHKIIDRLRKKDREQAVDFEALEQAPLSKLFNEVEHWRNETAPLRWGSDPTNALKQKQFFNVLEQCLSKLPAAMRQIFLLREVEGRERDEISKQLELSSSNVGVILHRARLSLQHCLQTHWFLDVRTEGKS